MPGMGVLMSCAWDAAAGGLYPACCEWSCCMREEEDEEERATLLHARYRHEARLRRMGLLTLKREGDDVEQVVEQEGEGR